MEAKLTAYVKERLGIFHAIVDGIEKYLPGWITRNYEKAKFRDTFLINRPDQLD